VGLPSRYWDSLIQSRLLVAAVTYVFHLVVGIVLFALVLLFTVAIGYLTQFLSKAGLGDSPPQILMRTVVDWLKPLLFAADALFFILFLLRETLNFTRDIFERN